MNVFIKTYIETNNKNPRKRRYAKSEANFLVKYREKSTSQIYFASYLIQVSFWYKHAFLYKLKLLTAKIAFPSPSSRASSIKAILSVKDLYSSKE